jgi:hypothetical protein
MAEPSGRPSSNLRFARVYLVELAVLGYNTGWVTSTALAGSEAFGPKLVPAVVQKAHETLAPVPAKRPDH